MNKEWSELNKTMQTELKKRGTFNQGIFSLMKLRDELWNTILSLKNELSSDEFNAIPFINAEGYHSKTIAFIMLQIHNSFGNPISIDESFDISMNVLISGMEQYRKL